jgi:aspartyl aminopeptidase
MSIGLNEAKIYGKKFLEFVNEAVSPWHATNEVKQRLLKAGFIHLNEKKNWKLKKNEKYFVTRNQSSIISFTVGGKYEVILKYKKR